MFRRSSKSDRLLGARDSETGVIRSSAGTGPPPVAAVPPSPVLSARDAGQGIESPHRPDPPPAGSSASPATSIGRPAPIACERRILRPAPMSADGLRDRSEHVIVPLAGDQAGAGGLEPHHGYVDPAPTQVRDGLQQDLRSGESSEIDVAHASAAGKKRSCGLPEVPAAQKYGRGPPYGSADQVRCREHDPHEQRAHAGQ